LTSNFRLFEKPSIMVIKIQQGVGNRSRLKAGKKKPGADLRAGLAQFT
jgi:hypothetical protein